MCVRDLRFFREALMKQAYQGGGRVAGREVHSLPLGKNSFPISGAKYA